MSLNYWPDESPGRIEIDFTPAERVERTRKWGYVSLLRFELIPSREELGLSEAVAIDALCVGDEVSTPGGMYCVVRRSHREEPATDSTVPAHVVTVELESV